MTDANSLRYKMVIETDTGHNVAKAEFVMPYDVSQFIDACVAKLVIKLEDELAEKGHHIKDDGFYAYMVNEELGVMWVLQFPKELNNDELTS